MSQPTRISAKNCFPYCGYLPIQFHKDNVICQLFEANRESDNATSGEWLHQYSWRVLEIPKPLSDARDEPRFAARVSKRAALRNGRYIDHVLRGRNLTHRHLEIGVRTAH